MHMLSLSKLLYFHIIQNKSKDEKNKNKIRIVTLSELFVAMRCSL